MLAQYNSECREGDGVNAPLKQGRRRQVTADTNATISQERLQRL